MFRIICVISVFTVSVYCWPIPADLKAHILQLLFKRRVSISRGIETTGPSYQAFIDVIKNDSSCIDPEVIWSCQSTRCPGSIISSNAVILPAHCVDNARDPVYGVTVIAGAHNSRIEDRNWQTVFGSNIIIHPEYNRTSGENDVAIVTTLNPLKFNDHVRKITLLTADTGTLSGVNATLMGWREPYEGGFEPVPEYELNVTIIDNIKCSESYDNIDDHLLCTSGEGGVGACHGDEGSPLVIDGVLVGMVQRVPIICDNSDPTVYIRISKYIDWIHDII